MTASIYAYTRKQAQEDGFLAEVSSTPPRRTSRFPCFSRAQFMTDNQFGLNLAYRRTERLAQPRLVLLNFESALTNA